MSILIENASYVVTQDKNRRILRDVDIFIENKTIENIGKKLKEKAEFVIDGRDKVVLPGLINLHTHSAMTLFRGFEDDMNLFGWLNKIRPIEEKLRRKDLFLGSLIAIAEMIKSGTTSFLDMYFFPEETAKSVNDSGVRGFLSYPIIEDKFSREDRMSLAKAFIKKWKGKNRIYPSPAPHSIFLCSEETLQKCNDISKKYSSILNIHVSETEKESNDSMKKFGMSPVSYLNKLKILSPKLVAAHSIWVSEKDMATMANAGVNVAHCPVSNMKLASGLAPVYQMKKLGVNVGLGTDSAASNNNLDLFEEMKISVLLQKMKYGEAKIVSSQDALDMATINGARALGMESLLGSIEKSKFADLITVNLSKPHLQPVHDIVSNLVYSANGSDVADMIVDGKIVMNDRNLKTINEMETLEKFESQVKNIFKR
ncbi:MAG: amidohydrolase [Candidatus Aenigmatarchaeota archaeon]